jgi:hypothetical protein
MTDSRDDEPIKVKAESKTDARKVAAGHLRNRFGLGGVYTLKEFRERDPWWHAHFWGEKAINER